MPIKKFMLLISLGLSLFLMPKPASADLTADLNRPNQTIELRENLSFKHKNYDIKLDGEKVGYVTGDFFIRLVIRFPSMIIQVRSSIRSVNNDVVGVLV